MSPQNNFYGTQVALAASLVIFHGKRVRDITGGQLPVVCLKSLDGGKSLGKSGVARLMMKCSSSWERNKLSPRLKRETIQKKLALTTCPVLFDDIKDPKFLDRNTEGFDDGEVYETNEGEFTRKAEIIITANYFGLEEGNLDGERILDRLSVIPFVEWDEMSPSEFTRRQKRFKKVIDDPQKPTEFLIGEIGNTFNYSKY